jgi:hypothetical protein
LIDYVLKIHVSPSPSLMWRLSECEATAQGGR